MPLTLEYHAQTTVPVEVEGLTPDAVRTLALAEIERFEIFHGKEKLPLAELFAISGDAGDGRIEFHGDLSGVHWIGAQMTSGAIVVHGPAGRHLGSGMRGGEIHVHGDVGDWVGAEMRGGLIHVRGDAGNQPGAAYRGSPRGMRGGTLLIEGRAGQEVGLKMRRGLIAVAGDVGDMPGFNMIAGTILLGGACGARPGAGMKRGTIALLGGHTPTLLPTFRHACRFRPPAMPLIANHLRRHNFPLAPSIQDSSYDLYNGDLLTVGKGEILVRMKNSN